MGEDWYKWPKPLINQQSDAELKIFALSHNIISGKEGAEAMQSICQRILTAEKMSHILMTVR